MKFNPAALRHSREQAGLSKPQLSKKARVGLATVYDLEREGNDEKPKSPTPEVVTRLAEALGVDWRFFYDDTFRSFVTSAAAG